MGPILTVVALERSIIGTRGVEQLRNDNYAPASLKWGNYLTDIVIRRELIDNLHRNQNNNRRVVTIVLRRRGCTTILADVQYQSINNDTQHLSLVAVKPNEILKLQVPVRVLKDERHQAGLLFSIGKRKVRVVCLPESAPHALNIDLRKDIPNGKVFVSDLILPKGVKLTELETKRNSLVLSQVLVKRESGTTDDKTTTGTLNDVLANKQPAGKERKEEEKES